MNNLERRDMNFPQGSEIEWVAFRERTKAILRTVFDAWLHRVLAKPTGAEPRVEVNLDDLNEQLLNNLLPFQDFREEWLKARKEGARDNPGSSR